MRVWFCTCLPCHQQGALAGESFGLGNVVIYNESYMTLLHLHLPLAQLSKTFVESLIRRCPLLDSLLLDCCDLQGHGFTTEGVEPYAALTVVHVSSHECANNLSVQTTTGANVSVREAACVEETVCTSAACASAAIRVTR